MSDPDPHGQAALMLCESLALLLVERGIISKQDVLNAIDGIIEVKKEIAGKRKSVVVSAASIILLRTLSQSFSAAALPDALTVRQLPQVHKKSDK